MSGSDFLDTNVLIYAFTPDDDKAHMAETLLGAKPLISVQGLNEMVNVLLRKRAFSWLEVDEVMDSVIRLCEVRPQSVATHQQARELVQRYRLNWWDSLQLACALEAEATTFWSEDLQHGLWVEQQLRVRNPFRRDPDLGLTGAH